MNDAVDKYICPMCPGVESDGSDACPKCGMALEPAAPLPKRQAQYTCPMHPEIVRDAPGACPKCGMALEPMTVSAAEMSPELVDMTRRFWVGASSFVMRAERVGAETMLAQIVQMVAAAQRSRAPIQRFADMVAGYFVPIVVATAVLAFGAWALWGPPPALAHALVAAVTVLIIACPCALGLATPMSIQVGIGRGAQAGVFYPAFGLLLSPIIAAAAMSMSSLSVVGNALRLRTARI